MVQKRKKSKKPYVADKTKYKVYVDEDGNIIENKKGLPVKLTDEVVQDALVCLDETPVSEEVPKIVNGKRVFDNRLQGQVWRPEDKKNRKALAKLLPLYYSHFSGDEEVAEMLGLRVDTLKNWFKIHQDLHDAKLEGQYKLKFMYLNAVQKSALGGTYKKQTVSNGEVFTVTTEVPPDVRALKMVLQQSFKGQFREEPIAAAMQNIQIAILNSEKKGL